MKKFSVLLLAAALVLGFAGCGDGDDDKGQDKDKKGDNYDKYFASTYRDNKNGSVEVINPTEYDMLLFKDKTLIPGNIVGGVRSLQTATINVSDFKDFVVGHFAVLHAVKLSEYKTEKGNSTVDYIAFITYRQGSQFRITLQSRFDGTYQYTTFNRHETFPLELRLNSPDGEKIGFLAKNESYHEMRAQTLTPFVIHPVWVAYNLRSKSLVSFAPKGMSNIQTIQPREEGVENRYYFPAQGAAPNFEIDVPFAYVQVANMTNYVVFFRVAANPRMPQSNIPGIISGDTATYEIVPPVGGGQDFNIAIGPQQEVRVNVRFEGKTESPRVEAGYVYTVVLEQQPGTAGDQASHYTAVLVQSDDPIDTSDFLATP